jgi:carbohydrate-selective porin OprB
MEYNIAKAHSETLEAEKKLNIKKRKGTVRFIVTNTYSRAPSYQSGIVAIAKEDTALLNVIDGKAENKTYGGHKLGLALNYEQELTNDLGLFSRVGWNDGKYATWAFTEIDQTASIGFSLKGNRWKRADDVFGIAGVVNGISQDHRTFLKDGGYGFIIGDGNLNYGHEAILETFYNARVTKTLFLTLDYQFVNNPAYNKDRGPVSVFAVRAHVEF